MFTHADITASWDKVPYPHEAIQRVAEFGHEAFLDRSSEESLEIYAGAREAFPSLLDFWISHLRSLLDEEWRKRYFDYGFVEMIDAANYKARIKSHANDLSPPFQMPIVLDGDPFEAFVIHLYHLEHATVAAFRDRYVAVHWSCAG